MEMIEDKNAAKKMIIILGISPIPKRTTTNGINAIGGTVLKNCIHGSITARATRYQPIVKATGIAHKTPKIIPVRTRCKLAAMSPSSTPDFSASTPVVIT